MNLPTPIELKRKRVELGLTQTELARAAGLSQGLIARIESGKIDPRLSTITKIVTILETAEKQIQRAEDIMTKPVITVKKNEAIDRAIKLMRDHGISQLPVLQKGIPLGIVTESALLIGIERSKDPSGIKKLPVSQYMGSVPPILPPSADLRSVLPLLELNTEVLISDKGKLVGIITRSNILESI